MATFKPQEELIRPHLAEPALRSFRTVLRFTRFSCFHCFAGGWEKLEIPLHQRVYSTVFLHRNRLGCFLAFSSFQTLNGKSRFDLDLAGGVLLLFSVVLFLPAACLIFHQLARQLMNLFHAADPNQNSLPG